jgi:hypothetical protein
LCQCTHEGRELDVLDGLPWSLFRSADELGLVEPVDGLGERVVERITDRADRRDRAELGESFAVTDAGELPASECATRPSRWAPRDQRAISSASRTMSVRMWAATRHPTIIRENASTMKHTYATPDHVGT